VARREGSIEALGDGRFRVRVFLGRDASGKRLYKSKAVRGTRRDAQKALAELARQRDAGVDLNGGAPRFGQYLLGWLESRTRLRASTRRMNLDYARRLIVPALGEIRLSELRSTHLQRWVSGLDRDGYAPATIRTAWRVVRRCLRVAVQQRQLAYDPCVGVELPEARQVNPRRALTEAERTALFHAARGTRFEVLWHLLSVTGMRPQEALGLTWSHVELDGGRLHIEQVVTRDAQGRPVLGPPKVKRADRWVPLAPQLVALLRLHRAAQAEHALRMGAKYLREADLVFATETGTLIDRCNLASREWAQLCRASGVRAALYDLRHTAASLALAALPDPAAVAGLLGNSEMTLLRTYVKETEGARARVAAALAEQLYGGAGR
jgi:integrase